MITSRNPVPGYGIPYGQENQFEDYLTHPYLFNNFTWDSTAITAIVTADVSNSYLSSLSSVSTKYKGFSYASGTLCVRIVVQGQSFAYGQLVFAFDPRPLNPYGTSTNFSSVQKPRSKLVPHITIDPSKDATYELELSPCSMTGLWSVDATNHGSYELTQLVFNPIGSGSATASSVNVAMYLYMKNPRFQAMTLLSGELKEGGVVSSTLRSFSKAAAAVAPVFGPMATTISEALGNASSVFSWFGFSKPNIPDVLLPVINRTVDNYTQTDSRSSSYKLANSSVNSIGLSDGYFPVGKLEDQIIPKLCARSCLVSQTSVTAAVAAGAQVLSMGVDPTLCFALDTPAITNGYELTPLAHMALGFTYWCGDITVNFEFIASVFHRATFLIAYDPNPSATQVYGPSYYKLTHEIVQVSGNTSVDIVIPWRQQQPALTTIKPHSSYNGTGNGQITVYLINPVTSNGSTDPIYLNVYQSSSNIRFAIPALTNVTKMNPVLTSGELVPATLVPFGPPTRLDDFDLRFFGESADRTTKDYASRISPAVLTETINSTTTAGTVLTAITSVSPNLCYASNSGTFVNYYSLMALGYLGTRGSISYMSTFLYPPVGGTLNPLRVAIYDPYINNNSFSSSFYDGTITPGSFISNYHYAYLTIHPNFEFTVPHYIPYLFRLNVGTSTVTTPESVSIVTSVVATTTSVTYNEMLSQGLGDDGQFVFYRGCPTTLF